MDAVTVGAAVSIANVVVHVADVDRALAFYRDGLSLTVRFDTGWSSPAPMLALSGTPDGTPMRIVALTLDGTAGLTLCSFRTPPGAQDAFEAAGQVHVGFVVEDLDRTLARLLEHGGSLLGTPGSVGRPPGTAKLAFVRDPDGALIELVQHLPGAHAGVGER